MELKTVTISSKGQIALPNAFRSQAGFHEGDKVMLIEKEGRIEIIPAENDEDLIRSLFGCLPNIRMRTPEERNKDAEEFIKRVRRDSAR